jgi:hypothetical protein
MPKQGLHRAEVSTRSIEQTRCGVTQPVPIKTPQSEPYGSRPELPIKQVAATKGRSHSGREDKGRTASLLLQTEDLDRHRRQRHNPPAPLRLGRIELPFVDRLMIFPDSYWLSKFQSIEL